jgi:hypothetical protein
VTRFPTGDFIILYSFSSLFLRPRRRRQNVVSRMLADTTPIYSVLNFFISMVLIGYLFFHSSTVPSRPRATHCWGFTIMLRHTTLVRTPLDEWLARRRDLYPITYNIHKRQIPTPPARFEPAIPASVWPQTVRPQGSASDCSLLCHNIGIFHLPKGF